MRIITGCMHPTPTDYSPILLGIQPVELRRQGATLSMAYRSVMETNHLLHQFSKLPELRIRVAQ